VPLNPDSESLVNRASRRVIHGDHGIDGIDAGHSSLRWCRPSVAKQTLYWEPFLAILRGNHEPLPVSLVAAPVGEDLPPTVPGGLES